MKKIIYGTVILLVMLILTSCNNTPNSNTILAKKQEQLMQEANRQVGMPSIVNFQEKKILKMIFELRDQAKVMTFTYLISEMNGKPVFLGKSVGYGIPYATQFTNPEIIARADNYGVATLPQADPNGLFMPSSAEGTWVMLVNPDTNEPEVVYIEGRILVSPFKLTI